MAYDGSRFALGARAEAQVLREDFHRSERLIVLAGASASGALLGFAAALAMGRLELWATVLAAAPVFVLAFYLTGQTLREALARDARGCATASILHAAALLSWPMAALLIPLGGLNFFIAPAAALGTLVLFASCWGGPPRAIYRMIAQGALVAAAAAHQGIIILLA